MTAVAARPRFGLTGKLPAHGDFIRRGTLPGSFMKPWDAWLEQGLTTARAAIGTERWDTTWDAAPAWRFALPAGRCGPDAVAGVLLPSRDAVGRRFPLTLAAVGDEVARVPAAWFAAAEGAGRAGLTLGEDVDAVMARLPAPDLSPAFPIGQQGTADPTATEGGGASTKTPGAVSSPGSESVAGRSCRIDIVSRWWTADAADGTPGLVWDQAGLPPAETFALLLQAEP